MIVQSMRMFFVRGAKIAEYELKISVKHKCN